VLIVAAVISAETQELENYSKEFSSEEISNK